MPEQLIGSQPRRANVEPTEETVVTLTGGTVVNDLIDALVIKKCAFYHASPGAPGSVFSWSFQLAAGTYDFNIITLGNYASAGIMQYKVDGTVIATIDPFFIVSAYNILTTTSGVVIPTSGNHQLLLTCTGKNVLNTDYEIWLDAMWFSPTTD